MIDEADPGRGVPPEVPQQRRPHAEAWLGRTVADSAEAPRIARSGRGGLTAPQDDSVEEASGDDDDEDNGAADD